MKAQLEELKDADMSVVLMSKDEESCLLDVMQASWQAQSPLKFHHVQTPRGNSILPMLTWWLHPARSLPLSQRLSLVATGLHLQKLCNVVLVLQKTMNPSLWTASWPSMEMRFSMTCYSMVGTGFLLRLSSLCLFSDEPASISKWLPFANKVASLSSKLALQTTLHVEPPRTALGHILATVKHSSSQTKHHCKKKSPRS